jgi:hypothetical protein
MPCNMVQKVSFAVYVSLSCVIRVSLLVGVAGGDGFLDHALNLVPAVSLNVLLHLQESRIS